MHARQLVPATVTRLALFQAGVVTRQQALDAGLSRHVIDRLIAEGSWRTICRGVFVIDGPVNWEALAWAGILVAGEGSRLGAAAAGYAAGLIDQAPERMQIWLPIRDDLPRRQPVQGGWDFRRESAGVRDLSVGSPPRTGIADTVLDLVSAGDRSQAAGWVSSAVQRRLTHPRRLLAALDRRRGCRHQTLIRSLLADVAAGAESPLEIGYLRRVERAHGLPTATRQARSRGTCIDALYDEYGLAVELDGRVGHVGVGRFRDMARDNRSTGAGLATLRYGWSDVDGRPCAVAAQVAQVLSLRGWTGRFTPCPRCRSLQLSTLPA